MATRLTNVRKSRTRKAEVAGKLTRAPSAAVLTALADAAALTQGSARRQGILTLALPAGRIREEAIALFGKAGFDLSAASASRAGRRLLIAIEEEQLRVLIVRDTDVPAYVEYGAADLGIAGRDQLDEQGRDLYEPLDLGLGRCRMVIAEPEDRPVDESAHIHLRYATKFPEITRRHLQARGAVAEVIKLYGSIEIAPLVGLADRIVDLVSTGETLRQHRLREVEAIMEVSARLCVGRAAAKLMAARVDDLVRRLSQALDRRSAKG
jgi:ATP phosphoribosyltransferase